MDLLSDFDGYFKRSASSRSNEGDLSFCTGWSPAYSVLSILLQLQAFLLEIDDIDSESLADPDDPSVDQGVVASDSSAVLERMLVAIPAAVRASREFKCPCCPHHAPLAPWPPFPKDGLRLSISVDEQSNDLVCFHSKRGWKDACLGRGVRIDRNKNGKISRLAMGLDTVSWTAFHDMGVRCGVLDTKETWTHWFPLWINQEHGTRAFDLFKDVLTSIHAAHKPNRSFEPEWGFAMVQKLMNHFIVMIMNGDVYASERALEGYCYFHRWLQVFAATYPDVLEQKARKVADFVAKPECRHKDCVPDLGEFITLISLDIPTHWEDFKEAYLSECYARNALWVIRSHPELLETQNRPDLDRVRPELTFSVNAVSMRLCLFHVYFLRHVGRPAGMTGEEVARRYDERFGRPSRMMRMEWQVSCREILKVSSWNQYFEALGDPPKSREELNRFLCHSMATSPYVAAELRQRSKSQNSHGPSKPKWSSARGATGNERNRRKA